MGVKFRGWMLMSSKMSNKAKQKILPKIRFPDFQDASEWDKKRLDEVARFVNDRLPLEKLSVTNYISTENILSNFRGITISAKLPTTTTATKFKANDILISNIRPYLKKIWLSNKDGGASNDVIVLRNKETIVTNFLSSVLKSDVFINYVMKGAKGVKMPRGDLSQIKEYLIAYPFDKKEQQKIADCLSSIDELITAESKKLDVLKAYKKGLMQQLFPAEGETLPKLRFPEFQAEREWEKVPLKKVLSIFQGFAFSSNDAAKQGVRWLKIADVGIQVMNHNTSSFLPEEYKTKYDRYLVKKDDLVVALTRPILNGCLKIAIVDEVLHDALLNQRVGKVIAFQNKTFVYYLMQTSRLIGDIEKRIAGSEPPNLSPNQINAISTLVPSKREQKKIAEILSSIDVLITNQSKKLDVLKDHKKGLMKQLFPTAGDVMG